MELWAPLRQPLTGARSTVTQMGTRLLQRVFDFNQWERDRWVTGQARLLPAGTKVLDVGAGPCRYRDAFAHCDYKSQDFCRHTGSTSGPLADKGTWKYGPIDYVSDATSIPVADGSFDVGLHCRLPRHGCEETVMPSLYLLGRQSAIARAVSICSALTLSCRDSAAWL